MRLSKLYKVLLFLLLSCSLLLYPCYATPIFELRNLQKLSHDIKYFLPIKTYGRTPVFIHVLMVYADNPLLLAVSSIVNIKGAFCVSSSHISFFVGTVSITFMLSFCLLLVLLLFTVFFIFNALSLIKHNILFWKNNRFCLVEHKPLHGYICQFFSNLYSPAILLFLPFNFCV